jgi:hypothetical protein
VSERGQGAVELAVVAPLVLAAALLLARAVLGVCSALEAESGAERGRAAVSARSDPAAVVRVALGDDVRLHPAGRGLRVLVPLPALGAWRGFAAAGP